MATMRCNAATHGQDDLPGQLLLPEGSAQQAAECQGKALGRKVRVAGTPAAVNDLHAAKVLMLLGHWTYGVSDPSVQQIWWERLR
jgi:hypothetical protein